MELLNSNYFLANEYTQAKNIATANISMFKNKLEQEDNGYTNNYLEMGNCTFFNKDGNIMSVMKGWLQETETFDFSNYLPYNYLNTELDLTEKEFLQAGIVESVKTLFGKKFYKINRDFFEKTTNDVLYVLDNDDFRLCEWDLKGCIKVHSNKFLVWY